MTRALIYAIVLGTIGFAGGFFGPMILDPTSGNGPMLGIFITGPGGFILGALTFFPALALGPILDHLQLFAGHLAGGG